uniref:Carbonic anhydrase n=1 Tax=Panagrolaimus davidi TaxID=227884 RepID=A0A914PEK0_9BILA
MFFQCLLFLFALSSLKAAFIANEFNWQYSSFYGSDKWEGLCSTGKSQSPIDINTTDVDTVHYSKLNFVNYDKNGSVDLNDNGLTVIVSGFDSWGKNQPYITGGSSKHEYELIQLHIHWSQHDDEKGSEHAINGKYYPAEVHLLHVKKGFNHVEALSQPDGILVVALLLTLGNSSKAFAPFEDDFKTMLLPFFGNIPESVENYQPKTILPSYTDSYYQYKGSLTTPGCYESVVFIVLAEPVSMTSYQLELLRNIRHYDPSEVSDNVRPVQPLNGRRVLFRPKTNSTKSKRSRKSKHVYTKKH